MDLLIAFLSLVVGAAVLALLIRHLRFKHYREELATKPEQRGAKLVDDYERSKAKIESSGAKTIAIIHDFGNPNSNNNDDREYLSVREAFEVLAEIRSVAKHTPIDLILHTPGGSPFACELIAQALKDRPHTTAYVPYCAMSAGTVIALSTERVVMGKHACLGPIDTQYGPFPADSFQRLLKEKPIQNIDDYTILLSYLVEKDVKIANARACSLLNKKHFGPDDACQLSNFLVSGDLPHSEQIYRDRAKQLGVNVAEEDCPDAVYQLVETRLKLLRSLSGRGDDFDLDDVLKTP